MHIFQKLNRETTFSKQKLDNMVLKLTTATEDHNKEVAELKNSLRTETLMKNNVEKQVRDLQAKLFALQAKSPSPVSRN